MTETATTVLCAGAPSPILGPTISHLLCSLLWAPGLGPPSSASPKPDPPRDEEPSHKCTNNLELVPVEHVVGGEALPREQVPEALSRVLVFRLVLKVQRAAEVQLRGTLSWQTKKSTLTSFAPTRLQAWAAAVCQGPWQGLQTLTWVAFTQHLDEYLHILLSDLLILMPLGGNLQPWPGLGAQVKYLSTKPSLNP